MAALSLIDPVENVRKTRRGRLKSVIKPTQVQMRAKHCLTSSSHPELPAAETARGHKRHQANFPPATFGGTLGTSSTARSKNHKQTPECHLHRGSTDAVPPSESAQQQSQSQARSRHRQRRRPGTAASGSRCFGRAAGRCTACPARSECSRTCRGIPSGQSSSHRDQSPRASSRSERQSRTQGPRSLRRRTEHSRPRCTSRNQLPAGLAS